MEKGESQERFRKQLSQYFSELGKKGGSLGGKTAAAKMTAKQRKARAKKAGLSRTTKLTSQQRKEVARKAAQARWQKQKKQAGAK
jgi:hypothetical protein